MKNKLPIIIGVIALLLVGTGIVVYKAVTASPAAPKSTDTVENNISLPTVDASVVVSLSKSAAKANTVLLNVKGLGNKYATVGYEFSYESKGLIKGVNSGSKPLDVAGKDSFDREVYLGTCSKNDCTPDAGVTKITVVLEFTDSQGQKSQFSKDFDI
jgi:hypothetical protein